MEKDSTSSIEADKGQDAHEPDQSALAPATPLPSREQVDKESQPESQQVEQGTGIGNPTIKPESGKVGDGTGGLPLGSRGPSIPPGHVHKPKSATEDAYIPGNKSTRKKKRVQHRSGKAIFRAGGGGAGEDGSEGDLSGSRRGR